jgi:putative SOS response-associated peptidase YedK
MCGRFALIRKLEDIKRRYGAQGEFDWSGNYNVCPTHKVPVVLEGGNGREIKLMRWGLIPFWSEDGKTKFATFNARSDNVAKSPLYREPFKKRRCIIPANGFFEWKTKEEPYWFTPKDDFFSFCGLWDSWKNPNGEVVESCTMITTDANDMVAKVHKRMPCAVTDNMIGAWLSEKTPHEELQSFLSPYPASRMIATPVSKYVNKVQNTGPECIAPLNSN